MQPAFSFKLKNRSSDRQGCPAWLSEGTGWSLHLAAGPRVPSHISSPFVFNLGSYTSQSVHLQNDSLVQMAQGDQGQLQINLCQVSIYRKQSDQAPDRESEDRGWSGGGGLRATQNSSRSLAYAILFNLGKKRSSTLRRNTLRGIKGDSTIVKLMRGELTTPTPAILSVPSLSACSSHKH